MNINIAVVGVNHNLAPINIREGVYFTDTKKIEAINYFLDKGIEEVVILSTCNRSEIYIKSNELDEKIELVNNFFEEFFNEKEIKKYLFSKKYDKVVNLFILPSPITKAFLFFRVPILLFINFTPI